MVRIIMAIGLFAILILGCGDENVTYVNDMKGVVYGRIDSEETGIIVEAWQAALVKSVTADSGGYFSMTDLQPGLYDIKITAPSGKRKTVRNVNVNYDYANALGTIEFSALGWPLLYSSPEDGDTDVLTRAFRIELRSEERLDLRSLSESVTSSPALAGQWQEQIGNTYLYYFEPEANPKSGTQYRVTLGSDLKLKSGQAWGKTYSLAFTTQAFAVDNVNFYPSSRWEIPLNVSSLMLVQFNAPIDTSNVGRFVSIEPPLEMVVTYESSGYYGEENNALHIFVQSGQRPGSRYTLRLDPHLSAADGGTLGREEIIEFGMQPLAVTYYRVGSVSSGYYYGDTLIEPGDAFSSSISFNTEVDIDSLNVALTFTPAIEGFWYRSNFNCPGDGRYSFFPTAGQKFEPEQTIILRVDGKVGLVDGTGMGPDWVKSFRVHPVRVTTITPTPGTRGVRNWDDISFSFNVPMDHASTEAAFSMTSYSGIPISGTFAWSVWSGDYRLVFEPTSALAAGEIYMVRVDTTALSQSGTHLKNEASTFFEFGE